MEKEENVKESLTKLDKSNYILQDKNGFSYISVLNGFDWPFKNDPRFWENRHEVKKYSYTDQGAWHLEMISWVDISFSFLFVKKGNYKLFIHDGGTPKHDFLRIKDFLNLSVYINQKRIVFASPYPTEEIVDKYKEGSNELYENLVGYISEEQFQNLKPDEHGDYTVTVKLIHNNMRHKSGWFIDGGRLLRIDQETIDKVKDKNKHKINPLLEIDDKYSSEVNLYNQDFIKIERDSSLKILNKNLLTIVFSYCNEKDLANLMGVNVRIRQISMEIFKKLEKLVEVQDIIPNDIYKSLYKYPKTINDNFVAFDSKGNKSYIAMLYSSVNEGEYIVSVDRKDSYYGGKSSYLKDMCWIEVNINFFNIKKGNYKLFIHEYIPQNSNIINKFNLRVGINEKSIVDCSFPPEELKSSDDKLKEDFICFIQEKDFDGLTPNLKDNYVVRIDFWHKELWWKKKWLIDGARLVEIKDLKEITESGLKSFENNPNYNWRIV